MYYFKLAVKRFHKRVIPLFTILAVALIVFDFFNYGRSDIKLFFIKCGITLAIAAFGIIFTFIKYAGSLKKIEPLEKIFKEKGYCEEFLQCHISMYPAASSSQLLRRAGICLSLQQYDNARSIYSSFRNIEALNPMERAVFLSDNLALLLETGRVSEAQQLMNFNGNFLESFFNGKPNALCYYDNVACLLALEGNSQGAYAYCQRCIQLAESKNDDTQRVLAYCTKIKVLYVLGNIQQADLFVQEARQYIASIGHTEYVWLKDHYNSQVTKACGFGNMYLNMRNNSARQAGQNGRNKE